MGGRLSFPLIRQPIQLFHSESIPLSPRPELPEIAESEDRQVHHILHVPANESALALSKSSTLQRPHQNFDNPETETSAPISDTCGQKDRLYPDHTRADSPFSTIR